ncbi:GNAT family N-acetyltransferase [Paenibacillus rhizovicinus]|uniref:GNAT family N-acetyltransferase n=1 Tax=Paenibacillus rhizovicinus TaxID=2704463 RepID=A0A6C0P5L3_9BACL|nr:GNAT family N-acetyltransferase [Paenibacillus rhizovicinus]QHW33808.1 GNAT family N-acetyltransferase [Paenibacillus rhizovicinus]
MIIHSCNYKNHDGYRASFNRLSKLVFGIEFEVWYQKGAWDDRYICHSFVADEEVIANVSVSKMNLVIHGESIRALQIGTVMTHPEHRGKGLSKQLMEHVLDTYKDTCDLFFLFANRTALEYYPKFGFSAVPEHRFLLNISGEPKNNLISLEKLDVSTNEHWNFIKQRLSSRRPISKYFGVTNNEGLFQFYALNVFQECLYYSQSDDAIIVLEHEGDLLHLYDIVSDEEVDIEALVSRITAEGTRKVRFHFTPDQVIDKASAEPFGELEDVLFIKSRSDLGKLPAFCAPTLAHA